MSSKNGDRARHDRKRRENIHKRAQIRKLRNELLKPHPPQVQSAEPVKPLREIGNAAAV